MKKLLTSLAAFTALTAAASAADLPRRAAPPVFTPVPVFTWTGFYAGFNAGYGFDTSNAAPRSYYVAPGTTGPSGVVTGVGAIATFNRDTLDGFTGGGQIGYNYQFTPGSGIVVGVEADAQYVDFGAKRRDATVIGALNPGFAFTDPRGLASLDFFGTVRGRLGYAFDRILFYGTGGFAYASGSDERRFGGFSGNDNFRTGWTVGGGVEYALPTDSFLNFFRSSAVTFKVEGLYVNLDRGTGGPAPLVIGPTNGVEVVTASSGRRQDDFAVIRAGVNYKFGSY